MNLEPPAPGRQPSARRAERDERTGIVSCRRTWGTSHLLGHRPSAARSGAVVLAFTVVLLVGTSCSKSSDSSPSGQGGSGSTGSSASPGSSGSTGVTTAGDNGVPTFDVFVKNFTYHGMPKTVPANKPLLVSFSNKESFEIQHEFVVLKLTHGQTMHDVIADAKKKGDAAEDDWVHVADSGDPLDTGASTVVVMDLPPGHYLATCWQTGKAGGGSGPPHAAIGMIRPFQAS